jgi:hypothetical protein
MLKIIFKFLAQPIFNVGVLYLYHVSPSVDGKMSGALSMN